MGWLCVSHQLDSSPCFGFDDNWQVFTQNLCCVLLSKYQELVFFNILAESTKKSRLDLFYLSL